MKIAMLSTGEEVLHGDIVDTNAAWLGALLFEHGLGLSYRATVGDGLQEITDALLQMSLNYDIVIVNGGLGPTTDDLSAQAAANATGEPLALQQHWVNKMEAYFEKLGRKMPESNLKQAMIPQSATIIDNPVGTACGFNHQINHASFLFTPGVPFEFKQMVHEQIIPYLTQRMPHHIGQHCDKIYTIGAGESTLAELLDEIELPHGFQIGYRSYVPYIEVKLFSPKHAPQTKAIHDIICQKIAPFIVGDGLDLISNLSLQLKKREITLELCDKATAGEVGYQLHQNLEISQRLQHIVIEKDDLISGFDEALRRTRQQREKLQSAPDHLLTVGSFIEDNHKLIFILITNKETIGVQLCLLRDLKPQTRRQYIATLLMDLIRRYLLNLTLLPEYHWLDSKHCLII